MKYAVWLPDSSGRRWCDLCSLKLLVFIELFIVNKYTFETFETWRNMSLRCVGHMRKPSNLGDLAIYVGYLFLVCQIPHSCSKSLYLAYSLLYFLHNQNLLCHQTGHQDQILICHPKRSPYPKSQMLPLKRLPRSKSALPLPTRPPARPLTGTINWPYWIAKTNCSWDSLLVGVCDSSKRHL